MNCYIFFNLFCDLLGYLMVCYGHRIDWRRCRSRAPLRRWCSLGPLRLSFCIPCRRRLCHRRRRSWKICWICLVIQRLVGVSYFQSICAPGNVGSWRSSMKHAYGFGMKLEYVGVSWTDLEHIASRKAATRSSVSDPNFRTNRGKS